jgi:excinuclease UvrABC ATPase subunit
MKGDMSTIKHKIICDKCRGNGYIKLEVKNKKKVFQCWICNSEGEIYAQENTDKLTDDANAKQLH